ncbi:hypothetical protein K7432_018564 [Basidiobolus ranarum]|uniref:Uncharacterized protein n=1 Tax=Basidiobolus ranarum TaxID=34480 RepID=A0ABR2WC13_9FUNG
MTIIYLTTIVLAYKWKYISQYLSTTMANPNNTPQSKEAFCQPYEEILKEIKTTHYMEVVSIKEAFSMQLKELLLKSAEQNLKVVKLSNKVVVVDQAMQELSQQNQWLSEQVISL